MNILRVVYALFKHHCSIPLVLLLAWPMFAKATNIVVIRYEGGFAIGADSLRVGGKGGAGAVSHVCKVRIQGNLVLATLGSAGWYHKGVPDLRDLSDQLLHSAGGNAQQKSIELGNTILANSAFLQLLSLRPIPVAGWVFVDPTGAFQGTAEVTNGMPRVRQYHKDYVDLGASESTNKKLKQMIPQMPRTRSGAIDAVRQLLQSGLRSEPELVQPPFSLLTLDGVEGIRWIERGVCQ